jgi:alpha-tubulin suppressor-like RCC1 family protein
MLLPNVPGRRFVFVLSVCFFCSVATHAVAQQVATPTFTPGGNYYNLEQSVRIDCVTAGATINYTTNGVDPTSSDRVVASGGTVLVDHAITLKARATKTGLSPSAVQSAGYNILGKLAAGQNHSLTVKTDGMLWGWGKNANGQLGRGSTTTSPVPIAAQVRTSSTTFLTTVATAAGGATHSVAAKTDGTVWAVGGNASGQIGDGTTTQRLYAVQVKLSGGAALTGVNDVVAGSDHCVALKSGGTVWAWGLNTSGQIGIGTTTSPQKNPVQVKTNASTFLTGIVAIAAGDTHSLALKSDGTVWAWGLNSSGQLGNGNTTNQSFAVQVKVVGGAALTGVGDVAAGANHSLAKKNDSSLWAWGSNANGQLADGTTNPTSSSKQINAVQVKASVSTFFTGVSLIAGGASHSLASKSDGTLWAWGLNSSNQLGDGTSTQRVFPVQVKDTSGAFASGIIDFAAGAAHTLATKSDGTAWGWGLNSLGQAGSTATGVNPNVASAIVAGGPTMYIVVAYDDPDSDTLLTWKERELGTNPYSRDTDGDGMSDDYEVSHGLNPLVNDAYDDPDHDYFLNTQEYAAGTDPHNPDTDGDGALDGEDIYPLDIHFALKKQPLNTYAVVQIGAGGGGGIKINNLNTVLASQSLIKGLSSVNLGFNGVGLNDSDQVTGNRDYFYPPDRIQNVITYRPLHHAVIATGPGSIRDLGDGTVDNSYNDTTGAPTIDGTNQADSTANVISNSGMVIGTTYFYIDVTPPIDQGYPSVITFSDGALAHLESGPPSARFTGPTITPTAINDVADMAGFISYGGNCALWTGGTNVSLPFFHYPYDLNHDKYVAGAQWQPNNKYPLVWHDTETKYLATPFNTKNAEVYGINKDGIMVGYAYSYAADYSAILWQNGAYYNMNTQLDSDAVAAGWTVSTLWDINDHGIIVASGLRNGSGSLVLLLPGRILPDDNQRGVTGDLVASNLGGSGQQHFVSPKQAGGFVVLKAVGNNSSSNFAANYAWEGDGQAVAGSPDKRQIPRDAPGKFQVRLRELSTNTIVDTMNIWIVWCDITSSLVSGPTLNYGSRTSIATNWSYQSTIQPATIYDTTMDIPDLRGKNNTPVPHAAEPHAFDGAPLGNATYKWDITRQWRERDLVPTLSGIDVGFPAAGRLAATLPNPDIIQNTSLSTGSDGYPIDQLEGNDDGGNDDNPYTNNGRMTDSDPPSDGADNSAGSINDTAEFRTQFREFTRLEISNQWYRVSDYAYSRFHALFRKVNEAVLNQDINGNGTQTDILWKDDGSVSDTSNNGW